MTLYAAVDAIYYERFIFQQITTIRPHTGYRVQTTKVTKPVDTETQSPYTFTAQPR